MCFLQGVKCVIIPNKVTQNVEVFVEALENCGVTRLFAVTSLVKNILAFLEMEKKRTQLTKLQKVNHTFKTIL